MDDRAAIQAVINEYTYRLDRGDFQGFAELFAKGEWVLSGDDAFTLAGVDEIVSWLQGHVKTYEGGSLNTKHVTTNVTINVEDGADTATSHSYLILFQGVPPEFPLQPAFAGRYNDEFVKDEDGWRFSKREIVTDVLGDMSYHTKWEG